MASDSLDHVSILLIGRDISHIAVKAHRVQAAASALKRNHHLVDRRGGQQPSESLGLVEIYPGLLTLKLEQVQLRQHLILQALHNVRLPVNFQAKPGKFTSTATSAHCARHSMPRDIFH
jgi:hypothetical protein